MWVEITILHICSFNLYKKKKKKGNQKYLGICVQMLRIILCLLLIYFKVVDEYSS